MSFSAVSRCAQWYVRISVLAGKGLSEAASSSERAAVFPELHRGACAALSARAGLHVSASVRARWSARA